MRLLKKTAITCASIFLLTSTCFAEISPEKARILLEKSGSIDLIKEIPYSMALGVIEGAEEGGVKLKQNMKDTFVKKSVSLFHETKVIEQYIEQIAHTLTESEYEFILAWYNSELGKRITAKDVFYYSRAGYAQLKQAKSYMSNNTAIAQNTKIYDASYQEKSIEQMLEAMIDGIVLGVLAQHKEITSTKDIKALRLLITQMMLKEQPKIKAETIKDLTFVYKDFSKEELTIYLRTIETTAFKNFFNALIEANKGDVNSYITKFTVLFMQKKEWMQ